MGKNSVVVSGFFSEKPKFSYEHYGRKFFSGDILVIHGKREDKIPFNISEGSLEKVDIEFGAMYEVSGEIHSRKNADGRTEQYFLAKKITLSEDATFRNEVHVSGQVKRPTKVRITGNGAAIATVCLSVRRPETEDRFDSVMCTGFKGQAEVAETLVTGEVVEIAGRVSVYTSMVNNAQCLEVHIVHIERESE